MRSTNKPSDRPLAALTTPEFQLARDRCDRCYHPTTSRIVSYFNADAICMNCLETERELFQRLRQQGREPSEFAECGYLPEM